MTHRVLLIACSNRKSNAPGLLPAVERYDGGLYRILRKSLAAGYWDLNNVLILSARYGLIDGKHPLPTYDQKLTERDIPMLRPKVQRDLVDRWEGMGRPQLLVCVSNLYIKLLSGCPALGNATIASNLPIGKMHAKVSEWVRPSVGESKRQGLWD